MRETNPKYEEKRLRHLVASEARALEAIGVNSNPSVLDVGAGDGRVSFRLVDELGLFPSKIVFLDINEAELDVAQRNLLPSDSFEADFVVANLMDGLPFSDNSFDLCLALGDVVGVAAGGAVQQGVSELLRVTAPGGTAVFSLPTMAFLLFQAIKRGQSPAEILAVKRTGVISEWNENFGEGEFKTVPSVSQFTFGLINSGKVASVQTRRVFTDYYPFAARIIFTAKKSIDN